MVEVAVAVIVVALSLAGIFALAKQSINLASELDARLRAAQVAESEMERLRAAPPGKVLSYKVDPAADPGLTALRGGSAEVRISALPSDAGKGPPLNVVSVRVKWIGADWRPRELALSSILSPGEAGP